MENGMDHVLITGASRGIGRALAESYVRDRIPVIGTCRGAMEATDGIDWQEADVTDPASMNALAERLGDRRIGFLICNAGVYPDKGLPPEALTPELWAQCFAVNVAGVFLTVQTLRPLLDSGARVAIIGSAMGSSTRAWGGSYVYRASKAAVLNLGRNLATDLRDEGIAVGIYHPGWVRTDMGGALADIGTDRAVAGLRARFAALDVGHSGCFENYDGTQIDY